MVITITMKNVIKRGKIYWFRMGVPEDCRDDIGKRKVTQSLKTKDPTEAQRLAKSLTAEWKKKFQNIRNGSGEENPLIKSTTDNTVADFRKQLDDHMQHHLGDYLDSLTEEQLVTESEWCAECIAKIKTNDRSALDLTEPHVRKLLTATRATKVIRFSQLKPKIFESVYTSPNSF